MARYILIDNCSGYIYGDTADIDGKSYFHISPVEAARLVDESIGEYGRTYTEQSHDPRATVDGYHVYRADVRGSDAVGNIPDGQDQEMIEAVTRDCEYVCFVATSRDE